MASTEEASSQGEPGRVVLRLELASGSSEEPPSGSIAIEGRPEERFNGWIEMMAVVNAARVRGDVRAS
ncbi:MAG TPA: hypothetical protein VGH14_22110 [Solirubrobacterales bacterium]|jgi:hypothetical protein